MAGRALQAFISERRVGELRDDNGVWSFAYDPQWVADAAGYALSPALPKRNDPIVDASTLRPVQWYFDNLLPEEGARLLLAKEARVDAADAFGLLAAYGAESAGSLTLAAEAPGEASNLRRLEDAELQARIERLPQVPLARGAAKKMSLAGAQHKLAVVLQGEALFEPVGNRVSSHILKPDNVDPDYPHTVINEYFIMRLAGALRLEVPAVLRRYVPAPVYLIERFDRRRRDAELERLHLVDACQALNLDRQFKYREGTLERLRELATGCVAPAAARLRIFAWLVFNVLAGNSDAHLKNLSFLVDARDMRPAPFYDMVAVGVYGTPVFGKREWPGMPLAVSLPGCASFQDVTRPALLEAGNALGLHEETARRLLDDQLGRIEGAARRLLAEIEVANARLLGAQPALAATFAGETRCLRAIVEIVIRDSVARFK